MTMAPAAARGRRARAQGSWARAWALGVLGGAVCAAACTTTGLLRGAAAPAAAARAGSAAGGAASGAAEVTVRAARPAEVRDVSLLLASAFGGSGGSSAMPPAAPLRALAQRAHAYALEVSLAQRLSADAFRAGYADARAQRGEAQPGRRARAYELLVAEATPAGAPPGTPPAIVGAVELSVRELGCAAPAPTDGAAGAAGAAPARSIGDVGGGVRAVRAPYVSSLAVREAERRRGVARALLTHCERAAHGWGHDELILDVGAANGGARAMYGRAGFEAQGPTPLAERPALEALAAVAARGADARQARSSARLRKRLGGSAPPLDPNAHEPAAAAAVPAAPDGLAELLDAPTAAALARGARRFALELGIGLALSALLSRGGG